MITLAFELYATGDYTVEQLSATLTDRGLVTRPARHPAGPVSTSKLSSMLKDRYYLGYVTYKGEEYEGRHEALVTPELFARVQKVMEHRSGRGERQRVYHHYLKGRLWCGRCHDEGRESRILIQRATGRRGQDEYFYFFCRAKQQHQCSSHYLDIDDVCEMVEQEYHRVRMSPEFIAWLRNKIAEALDDRQRSAKLRQEELSIKLARLDRQEERLLDLAADETMPVAKVRTKLTKIRDQRTALGKELADVDSGLAAGADLIETALRIAEQPYELYRRMGPEARRHLNQAVFVKLYVDEDRISDRTYEEPFDVLIPAAARFDEISSSRDLEEESPEEQISCAVVFSPLEAVAGWSKPLKVGVGADNSNDVFWSKSIMVEMTGLEPVTPCLQSRCSSQLSYIPVGPKRAPPPAHPG